ncbi:MAG TPA: ROK family transcriptional regulator [Pyrinomonadaceae bacterium]|nr:ROK family transcriptional regulator [Pyrinomonadaceae bacterium]
MRKINQKNFRIARRGISREINRRIALDLVRTHQPISRADLARMMNMHRASITLLVNELLAEGVIVEGGTGESHRGRKPTFLYINAREQCVVGVDIRYTRTYITVTDLLGKQLMDIQSFPTERDPERLVAELGARIKSILSDHREIDSCAGVGVVVPGMVDRVTGTLLNAPTLGWRDVNLRDPLYAATGFLVHVENSGRACALAQVWAARGEATTFGDVVFVSVSDGVGVGVVVNGELLHGRHNIAGEFGHVPLNIDGPRCSCGSRGCWEAYISNIATLSRYYGRNLVEAPLASTEAATFDINDLIARARVGDQKALDALQATGQYLGLGLASIINSIDPARVYISGEITSAWELIESQVREALASRVLVAAAKGTELQLVPAGEYPRLQGAVALVTAPAFAAPKVA